MEYQKLTDLLDDTTNQLPKCTADDNDDDENNTDDNKNNIKGQ